MNSQPSDENRFDIMIVYTTDPMRGGHIYDHKKQGSLCGVEKRNPQVFSDVGTNPLKQWINDNGTFACRTCMKSFRKFQVTPISASTSPSK